MHKTSSLVADGGLFSNSYWYSLESLVSFLFEAVHVPSGLDELLFVRRVFLAKVALDNLLLIIRFEVCLMRWDQ